MTAPAIHAFLDFPGAVVAGDCVACGKVAVCAAEEYVPTDAVAPGGSVVTRGGLRYSVNSVLEPNPQSINVRGLSLFV